MGKYHVQCETEEWKFSCLGRYVYYSCYNNPKHKVAFERARYCWLTNSNMDGCLMFRLLAHLLGCYLVRIVGLSWNLPRSNV